MPLLTFNDGIVRLDKDRLDAIFVSANVSSALRFDEESQDSMSGSIKRPIGFEDAEIVIELELLTDEDKSCYDRLSTINRIFKRKKDNDIRVYNINNKHLLARGIRSVLFSELVSNEDNEDDIITVSLKFVEYEQPILRQEKSKSANKKDGDKSKQLISENSPEPMKELLLNLTPKQFGVKLT